MYVRGVEVWGGSHRECFYAKIGGFGDCRAPTTGKCNLAKFMYDADCQTAVCKKSYRPLTSAADFCNALIVNFLSSYAEGRKMRWPLMKRPEVKTSGFTADACLSLFFRDIPLIFHSCRVFYLSGGI